MCHELGWDALSEYVGDQWRADVYAARGRHRLAFEIQWSTQTLEVTRQRHAAYGTDVKCCWLFKRMPSQSRREVGPYEQQTTAERDLPMFRLSRTDSTFYVTVGERTVTLREFVEGRLQKRIRFCEQKRFVVREVQLVVQEVQCSRCNSLYDVFYPVEFIRSNCGAERDCYALDSLMGNPPPERPIDDLHNALLNLRGIESMFASELKPLRISIQSGWGRWRSRWDSWFGCPECDEPFRCAAAADTVLRDAHLLQGRDDDRVLCSKKVPCSERRAEPHWCFPLNSAFCT